MAQESSVLKVLDAALKKCINILKTAAQTIEDEGVSKYPIFIAHKQQVSMGLVLIDQEKQNSPLSFSASTLEEFVTKKLIETSKVDNFKQVYKEAENCICLFVLEDENANFVFAPY